MTRPFFSVVMNVYNGAPYLRATIASVLAQSFADWELVIWDDCSKDDSLAICREHADPRIRVHAAERNAGLGASRTAALALARGEWIAFLDQDDLWLPHKLAAQHALIAADSSGRVGLAYARAHRFDEQDRRVPFDPWYADGPLPEGDIFAALLARPSFIALSASAFSGEALRAIGPVPPHITFCTDYWLSLAVARDHRAVCAQEVSCLYRVHADSMSFRYRTRIHEEILAIIDAQAGPAHRGIVRRRRRVHQTWIGVEEFRAGQRARGVRRILARGSLPYLALRPLVLASRRARRQ